MSVDGIHWELQVAAEKPDTLWGPVNSDPARLQFFHFGVWSEQQGLARIPVNPIMDIQAMLAASEELLDELRRCHEQIPFPLMDRFEYWLLDNDMQPLALIDSSCSKNKLEHSGLPVWKATLLQEQEFCCQQYVCGDPSQTPASILESNVKQAAGSAQPAQWFRRQDNGDAVGMNGRVKDTLVARRLAAADFPETLLRIDWTDAEQQQLSRDFIEWSAPQLLTLQHLSYATRDRLEHAAAKRPEMVEKLWRLYPKIINENLLRKARVEARLRQVVA
jgi:hypothetical protein